MRAATSSPRTLAQAETLGGPASPDLRREIARATSGSYPGRTLEGLDCEFNFKTLSDQIGRWSVHLGVPIAALDRPIRRSLVAVGGGAVASLALAAALAGFVSSEISRRQTAEIERADAALDESEQRRSLAVEAAELGTWQWDFAGDRISGSGRCRLLFALADGPGPPPQWSSDAFLSALSADDRETLQGGGAAVDRHRGRFRGGVQRVRPRRACPMAARSGGERCPGAAPR